MRPSTHECGLMLIDCGNCQLRPWREGDQPSLVHHANDHAVWRNLRDRFPYPYTAADADTWVRVTAPLQPNFAIVIEDEAVGGIGLELHQDIERVSAEIGYWIGRSLWGRGLMTAVVQTATRHAFAAYPLTRIFAVPFTRNAASVRVLEKAGYRREGILRRSAVKEGEVLDQFMYAITDQDLAHAAQA